MDHKEAMIQAAISLIREKGDRLDDITVREICKRAGVGLGLLNYHFGNKDRLIEQCVEQMINSIIVRFQELQKETEGMSPFERLDYLGGMTLNFLFEHEAMSRISILTDMQTPKEDDNTSRTHRAYLPLVSACRPDWDEETVKRKTFCLITVMQQTFLRHETVSRMLGIPLNTQEARRAFHTQILHDILEV